MGQVGAVLWDMSPDMFAVAGPTVQQHLVEAITAVRLLGAQVVLTGVRPAIAQTLVQLGIDLSGITTRSSMAAA